MIRALVFDLDGLILDTESALIESYADVHAAHGVPFDRKPFMEGVGHADYSFDPWHAFEKRADRAALEAERSRRNKERNRELPPLPGARELIEAASAAGLKLAVASNSRHEHVDAQLKRLGLFSRFEFVACREDVPSPKPEPDVYRLAVNRLGVRAHDAVAIEDSHAGALAAHRAGLKVVAVPGASSAHQDFSAANLKLRSLADIDLPGLLARLDARQTKSS